MPTTAATPTKTPSTPSFAPSSRRRCHFGRSPPPPPRRAAGRVIRFDAPPAVRRAPRGSRSSREGPAATPAVYPRIGPVQEITKPFALIRNVSSPDTNGILPAMRLPAGERLLSTDALVVGHAGTAILPP